MSLWLIGVVLIALHAVDGVEILVNPEEIAVMRPSSEATRGTPNQVIVTGVYCVIGLTSGKYISVVETCDAVRTLIEKSDSLR